MGLWIVEDMFKVSVDAVVDFTMAIMRNQTMRHYIIEVFSCHNGFEKLQVCRGRLVEDEVGGQCQDGELIDEAVTPRLGPMNQVV
jgi:hypothetical protein